MKKLILLVAALVSTTAFASKIAIIDSGTDYRHPMLKNNYWLNTADVDANSVDEDGNGLVDDFYGWNFAEGNNKVIDYSYLGTFGPDVAEFFKVQTRILEGTATQADQDWMKAHKDNADFMAELQKFGNFAHGTHVAGISVRDRAESKVFAAKIIPTEVKLPFGQTNLIFAANTKASVKEILFKAGLAQLAKTQGTQLVPVGEYVGKQGADVANGSFGTSYEAIKPMIEQLYNVIFKEEERDPAKLDEFVVYFLNVVVSEMEKFVAAAPDTLFVFAAGNDGTDNDKLPASPTNVKADNTISVAATLKNRELATFSNFGAKMVDVAAPGVGIESSYPGNEMGLMSGTSQAAPYVTNLAGEMKNLNPELTPADLKTMIMATVDMKTWLKGKVKAGGFVNPERAFAAARASKSMDIHSAIAEARRSVRDMDVEKSNVRSGAAKDAVVLPLPSMFR